MKKISEFKFNMCKYKLKHYYLFVYIYYLYKTIIKKNIKYKISI